MNNDFFEAQEFYLIDTFNGNSKKSRIKFKVIENSKYKLKNTKEVAIESKTRKIDALTGEEYYEQSYYQAFMKSSKDIYKDDLDIINSEIAELFDVSCSKVFRVENNLNNFGIVNISIKENNEQQMGLDVLVNKLIKLIKEKNVSLTSWLKNYFSLPISDLNVLINKEEEIISVIEMTINTVSTLLSLNMEKQEELRRDFIKMIFFDLISNNSNRSFNTYSVLLNSDASFKKLSPIYDYNNEVEEKSYYLLNNVYLDKSAVFSTIYHNYYKYIKKLSKGLRDNYGLYFESITLITDNNTDELHANQIKDAYKNNLEVVKTLENIHSKDVSENKLDLAMTQTSINLNALNKNQIIHSKYRNIKRNELQKVEEVENVKIKVEEDNVENKKSKVGLVLLALILLVGIIAGIAYIFINR